VITVKKILSLLIALALMLFITGCTPDLTEDEQKLYDDINYLIETLPEVHYSIFEKIPDNEFYIEIYEVLDNVGIVDEETTLLNLNKVLALIGDAHTYMVYNEPEILPISVELIEDRYIIAETTEPNEQIINAELVEINGKSIDQLKEEMKAYIPHNGEYEYQFMFLRNLGNLKLIKNFVDDPEDGIFLTLLDGDMEYIHEVKLAQRESDNNLVYGYHDDSKRFVYSNRLYWFEQINERTLFIQYNSCFESPLYSMQEFVNNIVASKKESVDSIIIDLRNNQGGYAHVIKPLVDEISYGQLSSLENVYVMTSINTYSAGLLAANDIESTVDSTIIVGEPTGQSPNFNAGTSVLEVPNSSFAVQYSKNYVITDLRGDDKETLSPDQFIVYTFDNYLNGTDNQLDWILNDIESK
jgi:hypothetical protein